VRIWLTSSTGSDSSVKPDARIADSATLNRCPSYSRSAALRRIPRSSGPTYRHRLRGGDREADNALYIVVLGRLRYDPRTRAYAGCRTHEGLSKPPITRCLKRYVAREIFNALPMLVAEKSRDSVLILTAEHAHYGLRAVETPPQPVRRLLRAVTR
jgi:hypothetical protein